MKLKDKNLTINKLLKMKDGELLSLFMEIESNLHLSHIPAENLTNFNLKEKYLEIKSLHKKTNLLFNNATPAEIVLFAINVQDPDWKDKTNGSKLILDLLKNKNKVREYFEKTDNKYLSSIWEKILTSKSNPENVYVYLTNEKNSTVKALKINSSNLDEIKEILESTPNTDYVVTIEGNSPFLQLNINDKEYLIPIKGTHFIADESGQIFIMPSDQFEALYENIGNNNFKLRTLACNCIPLNDGNIEEIQKIIATTTNPNESLKLQKNKGKYELVINFPSHSQTFPFKDSNLLIQTETGTVLVMSEKEFNKKYNKPPVIKQHKSNLNKKEIKKIRS